MYSVPMQEQFGKCEHIIIASPEPWEPTCVQLDEVPSLPSDLGTICIFYGYDTYLNTELYEAIIHSMQPVLVGLKGVVL